MKLYSCDFEGCTATTYRYSRGGWQRIERVARVDWLFNAFPFCGNLWALLRFFVDDAYYLCPEHAKRIKGLVRT